MIDLLLKIYQEKCWCDWNYNSAIKFLEEALDIKYEGNEKVFNGLLIGTWYYEDSNFIEKENPNALDYRELVSVEMNRLDNCYFGTEKLRSIIQQIKFDFNSEKYTFNYIDYYKYVVENIPLDNDIIGIIRQIHTTLKNDLNRIFQLRVINQQFNVFDKDDLNLIEDEIKYCLNKLGDTKDSHIINKYLSSTLTINDIEILDPIEDYRDAGYIASDGTYYGLNGTVGNLLHIEIANKLFDQGIIPKNISNIDLWLENNGWIKQHNNSINYIHSHHMTPLQKLRIINLFDKAGHKTIILNGACISVTTFKSKDIEYLELL